MGSSTERSGGGFFNGLLLGLLLGGGAVFLFGTKRGKKLLKSISQEGLEGITEIGDLLEEGAEEMEEEESPSNGSQTNESSGISKASHRFFRGIPKRG